MTTMMKQNSGASEQTRPFSTESLKICPSFSGLSKPDLGLSKITDLIII